MPWSRKEKAKETDTENTRISGKGKEKEKVTVTHHTKALHVGAVSLPGARSNQRCLSREYCLRDSPSQGSPQPRQSYTVLRSDGRS